MKINLPVYYSQFDARWANSLLGFNTNSKYNFYNYACFITSIAMVCKYYGKDENPQTINDKLKSLGQNVGFVAGGGDYVYGAITKYFGDIKEKKTVTPSALTDSQLAEIRTAIDSKYPVIFQLDYNPKTVELDSHFVTVIGYNPSDENDFLIVDPLGGVEKSLKAYLGWFKPSVRNTVEKYLIYTGKVPAGAETVAVPKDVYPSIIHGSTEWDKTVAEYLPQSDPKVKNFEDVQRVVNGYKSDATSSKNALNEANSKLATANVEIANKTDQLANTKTECQRTIELKETEISALKLASPNIDKLKAQYQGTIDALQKDLTASQKAGGLKDLEIAELKSQLSGATPAIKNSGILEAFVKMIKGILG